MLRVADDEAIRAAGFSPDDLRCRCGCGALNVRQGLIRALVRIRSLAGLDALSLSSASRCAAHNAAVGGAKHSAHVTGQAADIMVDSSRQRFMVVRAALASGVSRVGVAGSFVHVDVSETRTPEVLWLY